MPGNRPREQKDVLNERAQRLLRSLVARYIRDGQPVGSQTLAQESGLEVSPATIRNVMADLEEMGFLQAPHTSAGRIPTVRGYRFFVDTLLRTEPLANQEMERLREQFPEVESTQHLINSASSLLSAVTHFVGLVTVPKRESFAFQYVDFVPLSGGRILAVLVFSDGEVQNRIIHPRSGFSAAELQRVANYLNEHYSGLTLRQVRQRLVAELRDTRERMYRVMGNAITVAESAFATDDPDDIVLAGETNLMDCSDLSDVDKLRRLFEAFHRKRELLSLMEQCIHGQGVRLFIGEESGYQALGECSVVTAPYTVDGRKLGVLGVIGPVRMDYDRVIPVVDATARLLSSALNPRG